MNTEHTVNTTLLSIKQKKQIGANNAKSISNVERFPKQLIFYGAPGTGKSHEIKERTQGDETVVRTTFHPDSDYSTFVGAYKPKMKKVDVMVTPVVTTNGIQVQPTGVVQEDRITYEFTTQAFLNAYIKAWEKVAKSSISSMPVDLILDDGKGTEWVVTRVEDDKVLSIVNTYFTRSKTVILNRIKNNGGAIFANTTDTDSDLVALCDYIVKSYGNDVQNLEEYWSHLITQLKNQEVIKVGDRQQQWNLKYKDDTNIELKAINEVTTNRDTTKSVFIGEKDGVGKALALANKLKELDSDFDVAWKTLGELVNHSSSSLTFLVERQFLIIEEINRGNCAQIFGDLFQLLDRGEAGFSEYPILADSDLQQKLYLELNQKSINFNPDVKNYIDGVFQKEYPNGIVDKILAGELLLLPSNLYIWATMNTSDQSLFPIDSAFKRRWEWKYMKIANMERNYKIEVNGKHYDWWVFVDKMNQIIGAATSSEDKKIGYFFCKVDEGKKVISSDQFVSKVLFYIYGDALKDYDIKDEAFVKEEKDGKKSYYTFSDFYDAKGNVNKDVVIALLDKFVKADEDKTE